MNLSAMSLGDMEELQEAFGLIHKGVSLLSRLPVNQGEVETSIDMTPGGVVIITTHFEMPGYFRCFGPPPDFEVVEGSEICGAAVPCEVCASDMLAQGAPGGSGNLQQRTNVESSPRVGGPGHETAQSEGALDAVPGPGEIPGPEGAATGSAGGIVLPDVASAAAPEPEKRGPILGPITAAERAEILRMDGEGLDAGKIGAALNRRPAQIGAILYYAKGKKSEIPAGQPFPAASNDAAGAAGFVPAEAGPEAEEPAQPDTGHASAAAPVVGGAATSPQLTARQRTLAAHLDRVHERRGFDADIDLEMVEALFAGAKAGQVALDLGIDSMALVQRFRELTAPLRDDRDRVSIDGQSDLLAMMRQRAADRRAKAVA